MIPRFKLNIDATTNRIGYLTPEPATSFFKFLSRCRRIKKVGPGVPGSSDLVNAPKRTLSTALRSK